MKNSRKIIMLFLFLMMALTITHEVYALGGAFDSSIYNQIANGQVSTEVSDFGERVYGTIMTVLKVAAVGGVAFTGVKYMMAGSGDKGKIKDSLIYVVIGTIFVFGADAIINFVRGLI